MHEITGHLELTNVVSDDESPSMAVVDAVTEAAGVEQTDLPPLYTVIDPDAVDSFFRSPLGIGSEDAKEIQFEYYGYEVTVTSDEITVATH